MRFDFYDTAPKEVVQSCNLCGGQRFLPAGLIDRYELIAPTVRCSACGLRFLLVRMTELAYRTFYMQGHYRKLLSVHYGKDITAHSIEAEQAVYAERLSTWLAPHMSEVASGLLLDLGGSTGVVAEHLCEAFDLDGTVVEPSAEEAQRAASRGLNTVAVTLANFPTTSHYNLVTLCQTVDHLLDIKADLARIRKWVAKGGLLFVDFVEDCPAKIDHPFYLNTDTMHAYLIQAGLKRVAMERSVDGIHMNVLAGVA